MTNINYDINFNANSAISNLNRFGGKALQVARNLNKMKKAMASNSAQLALLSQKGIHNAAVGTRLLGNNTKKATGFFARFKKEIRGVAGSMFTAMAAIAIVQRGVENLIETAQKAVRQYRYFNNSMHEVATIMQQIPENVDVAGEAFNSLNTNFEAMSAAISGFSKKFGKDANDLAKGMYDILSSAVDTGDSLFVLHTASKSAVAGLSDVSKSVDILTALMKSYNFSADQLVHINDVLFQGVIRGRFTYEKLESAMGYLIPIASQVGIEFEELMAVMTTATRKGQHLDMVSRGLALAIQNIIKPSEQARKAAEELGVDLSLAALRSEGLLGFLRQVNEATDDNAALFSKLIPNMRSYRVVMTLAGDGINEAAGDLDLMKTSLDKADEAFGKMAGSAKMAKDIVTQVSNEVSRSMGEMFSGLDIEIQKLDITKKTWMTQLFGGKMFDIEQYTDQTGGHGFKSNLLGVLNLMSLGAGEAFRQKKIIDERIDDQVSSYKEEWSKQLDNMDIDLGGETKKTPFEMLLEGQELDFSEMEAAGAEYTRLLDVWKLAGEQLGEAALRGEDTYQLELSFQKLTDRVMAAREEYSYWEGSIDSAKQAVENHSDTIDILTQRMGELKESIGEIGVLYDGELGKQLKVAEMEKRLGDMTHYLSFAKQEEIYQTELAEQGYEWYTDEVSQAIEVVRKYEQAQKDATNAQKEFNFELARNRIETMRLQLLGMMRRRGNTRQEQRMLKKLSIQRTQIQIEEAEKELENAGMVAEGVIDEREMAYREAVNILEKMTRAEEHSLWKTKDTRQEDIDNLRKTINSQEKMYAGYAVDVQKAYTKMNLAMDAHLILVKQKFGEESEEVKNLTKDYKALREMQSKTVASNTGGSQALAAYASISNVQDKFNNTNTPALHTVADTLGRIKSRFLAGSFARGVDYVPSEGIYQLHRGEQIIPRNETGGSPVVINVSVTGNTISNANSKDVAKEIANQINQKLMDSRTGKSRYRLR